MKKDRINLILRILAIVWFASVIFVSIALITYIFGFWRGNFIYWLLLITAIPKLLNIAKLKLK